MATFNTAVRSFPSAASYSARASAWYQLDRGKEFMADVRSALLLDSLYPEANYQYALIAQHLGQDTAAVRYATRALAHSVELDQRLRILVVRGKAFAGLGRNAQAINDLAKGTASGTDDLDALRTLAHLHDIGGDHETSLEILELLCKAAPNDIGNWCNRGFELNALGRYDEALSILDLALKMDKDEPTVLSNKAYALMKLGRDTDALTTVNHSLKVFPENAFALRTRGMLYLRKGDRDNGCKDLTLSKALGEGTAADPLINQYCGGLGSR